jgi:hypothetical protein
MDIPTLNLDEVRQRLSPLNDDQLVNALINILSLQQERLTAPTPHSTIPIQPPTQRLLEFKPLTTPAPSFSGDTRFLPAHEAQDKIENYLFEVESRAHLLRLRPSIVTETDYRDHPTYVQWASTGLKGTALTKWRKLDVTMRNNLSWNAYQEWIVKNFSSPLVISQAIKAMDTITQKGSAVTYSALFNNIVNALSSAGVIYPAKHLCTKYLQGLKPHLQSDKDLFAIEDLDDLQAEAERLDDFYWRMNQGNKGKNNAHQQGNQQHHRSNNQRQSSNLKEPFRPFRGQSSTSDNGRPHYNLAVDDPMEVDNITATTGRDRRKFIPLSDSEKQAYRNNGWCVYCRSHEHSIDHCQKLKKKRQNSDSNDHQRRVNLITVGESAASASSSGSQTNQ